MKRPRIFAHSTGNPVKVFSTDLNSSPKQSKSKPDDNISELTSNWLDADEKDFFETVLVPRFRK